MSRFFTFCSFGVLRGICPIRTQNCRKCSQFEQFFSVRVWLCVFTCVKECLWACWCVCLLLQTSVCGCVFLSEPLSSLHIHPLMILSACCRNVDRAALLPFATLANSSCCSCYRALHNLSQVISGARQLAEETTGIKGDVMAVVHTGESVFFYDLIFCHLTMVIFYFGALGHAWYLVCGDMMKVC